MLSSLVFFSFFCYSFSFSFFFFKVGICYSWHEQDYWMKPCAPEPCHRLHRTMSSLAACKLWHGANHSREEHPHCVQRSFITHTHIHARTHTHSLSHNMVCDGRRYSTESASERCHTHHTAAPWRFTLQRLQGGFLNIRMNEKIEYLTSESNSDVFRQNYNLIFFVRLCSSAFRLFWYWVLFDIC